MYATGETTFATIDMTKSFAQVFDQQLTLNQKAAQLQVHPETVRRHAAELGGRRVGRIWRFPQHGHTLVSSERPKPDAGIASPANETSPPGHAAKRDDEIEKAYRDLLLSPRQRTTRSRRISHSKSLASTQRITQGGTA